MSMVQDNAGTHDAFCGASNRRSNAERYGDGDNWGAHPNARDRFALAVSKFWTGPQGHPPLHQLVQERTDCGRWHHRICGGTLPRRPHADAARPK